MPERAELGGRQSPSKGSSAGQSHQRLLTFFSQEVGSIRTTSSMLVAACRSKMLESLMPSMAVRMMSVLSEGRRYFPKI